LFKDKYFKDLSIKNANLSAQISAYIDSTIPSFKEPKDEKFSGMVTEVFVSNAQNILYAQKFYVPSPTNNPILDSNAYLNIHACLGRASARRTRFICQWNKIKGIE